MFFCYYLFKIILKIDLESVKCPYKKMLKFMYNLLFYLLCYCYHILCSIFLLKPIKCTLKTQSSFQHILQVLNTRFNTILAWSPLEKSPPPLLVFELFHMQVIYGLSYGLKQIFTYLTINCRRSRTQQLKQYYDENNSQNMYSVH